MRAIISEIDPRDAYFDVRHKLIGRIVEIPDDPLPLEFSGTLLPHHLRILSWSLQAK